MIQRWLPVALAIWLFAGMPAMALHEHADSHPASEWRDVAFEGAGKQVSGKPKQHSHIASTLYDGHHLTHETGAEHELTDSCGLNVSVRVASLHSSRHRLAVVVRVSSTISHSGRAAQKPRASPSWIRPPSQAPPALSDVT